VPLFFVRLVPAAYDSERGIVKRILFNLFMTLIFLLLLGFALKNMDGVTLRYFLGFEWRAPLAIVVLVFFGIGIASGVLPSVAVIARQRRELLELKRELRDSTRSTVAPATAESI
jgi:putative membrane protein